MTNWEAYTTNVHCLNGTGGQKPESKMSAEHASAKGSGGPSLTSSSFSWLLAPLPLATRLQPLPPSHMPSSFRLSVVVFPPPPRQGFQSLDLRPSLNLILRSLANSTRKGTIFKQGPVLKFRWTRIFGDTSQFTIESHSVARAIGA